jgi:hypothetical protein
MAKSKKGDTDGKKKTGKGAAVKAKAGKGAGKEKGKKPPAPRPRSAPPPAPTGTEAPVTVPLSLGVNQNPVLDQPPNRTVVVGGSVSFYANAFDPDFDPITYSLVSPPLGAMINASTGQFSWVPQCAHVGNNTIRIRADDGQGGSDEKTCTVTVTNAAPSIDPVPNRQAKVGFMLSFHVNATDDRPPPQMLIFSLQGTPPLGATINQGTGQFTWIPAANQVGNHTITVRVADPCGLTFDRQFGVAVSA